MPRPKLSPFARVVHLADAVISVTALSALVGFCILTLSRALGPTQIAPMWTQLSAVRPTEPPPATLTATATPTTRPTLTPTSAPTLTLTPTSTPPPTPTPTALPIVVRSQSSAAPEWTPVPQEGAPCGVVDTLDFPLDPPDGRAAYGGGDFGRYQSRYGLYHAGEDWSYRGRGSDATPRLHHQSVHGIGHGTVTYAEPLAWGLDQGVVIVRHRFRDGSTALSFYGHLDPDSVQLKPGACVVRGEEIGRIGNPRTSPHLHFEIRTHLPHNPGRGYSVQDPALSGWKAPSAFIWQQRIAASPGVVWLRPRDSGETRDIGRLGADTYLLLQDTELIALDVRDGEAALWSSNWIVANHRLVVSGAGGKVWVLGQEGATALGTEAGGRLASAGKNALLIYDERGVHGLDMETGRVKQLYSLPGGFPGYGDLVTLQPDAVHLPKVRQGDAQADLGGDILVTHTDAAGDSLTALAPNGRVRWRRSFERVLRERRRLLSLDGRTYLVSLIRGLSYSEVLLYEIDLENAELIHTFTGGSRNPAVEDTWFAPVGDGRLMIHIGDVGTFVLDTQIAQRAVLTDRVSEVQQKSRWQGHLLKDEMRLSREVT